jgi:putative oxidoreductase
MATFMARYQEQAYALMRIVAGFLFLWHGTQKLFGLPIEPGGVVSPLLTYTAGPIELVGGVLIMIGLFSRWAAFVCSGQMAVAYWGFHASRGLTPLENHGELAVLYCFVFLFIATRGSGIWSVEGPGARGE